MQTMTAEERFQFDLEGYLVVPGVLTASEVVELNELADEIGVARIGSDIDR